MVVMVLVGSVLVLLWAGDGSGFNDGPGAARLSSAAARRLYKQLETSCSASALPLTSEVA